MRQYDTVEHDMRHSKEYLANIKFNFVEIIHKVIFLQKLKGNVIQMEPVKDLLIKKKEEIEKMRKKLEILSERMADVSISLEEKKKELIRIKEQEHIMLKRIEGASSKEQTIRHISKIREQHKKDLECIERIKEEISDKNKENRRRKETYDRKKSYFAEICRRREEIENKLEVLQKDANQQMVYQYNWYKQFSSVMKNLIGAKIIDVQQIEQKQPSSVYSSINGETQAAEEKIRRTSIKILAWHKDRTAIITLAFVDGKFDSYSIYRTKNNVQIPTAECQELFTYCQRTNSVKLFLFEGIAHQIHTDK